MKQESPGASSWKIAVVATLGMSVSYVDRQTLAAIAPSVRQALAIDHAQFGWLVSAFSMAYLVGAPAAGALVDRLGARRGFALAVFAWSLIAGAHALATSFAYLFALRVLLGMAESPSFPAATQAIRRALPGARRPLAYGLLFTGSSLGAVVAGKVAVKLDAAYGFRTAFVVTAAIGTFWIPLWLVATRGRRLATPESAADDSASQVSWKAMATSAPVLRAVVAVIGSAPALMFVLNWTSQYLVEAWHMPKADVGNYLVVPPLLFDAGAVGFGALTSARMADSRKGRNGRESPETHRDLLALATVLAASLALTPFAPSPSIAMAIFAAAAAGGGGIYVLVTADMLARVHARKTSSAGGMTAAAQSLAHVIASPLVGATIDRMHGYGAVLVALGAIVVPTSLAFALWPMPNRQATA